MTGPAWIAAAILALSIVALALGRTPGLGVRPKVKARLELLTLLGLGLLPIGLLACGATAVSALARPTLPVPFGLCFLFPGGGQWGPLELALYGGGLLLLMRLILSFVTAVRHTRRTGLGGAALSAACPRRAAGGEVVWVLPSEQILAFSGGAVRARAVVTSGLLALLSPKEQEAVLEHEAAHLRLGHPRLLLAGSIMAKASCWPPAARRILADLGLQLEAAADDEAAARLGSRPLISALAKVSLATTPRGTQATPGSAEVSFRLHHILGSARDAALLPRLAFGLLSVTVVVALAWAACQVVHASASLTWLLPCLAVLALGFWWPMATRREARRASG